MQKSKRVADQLEKLDLDMSAKGRIDPKSVGEGVGQGGVNLPGLGKQPSAEELKDLKDPDLAARGGGGISGRLKEEMDLITGMAPDRGHGDGPLEDPDDFDVPTRRGADPLISSSASDAEAAEAKKKADAEAEKKAKAEAKKKAENQEDETGDATYRCEEVLEGETSDAKITARRRSGSGTGSNDGPAWYAKVWAKVYGKGSEDSPKQSAPGGTRGQPNPEAGGAPPRTQEEMDAAMAEIRRKAEGIGGNMRDPADKTPIDPDAVVGSEVGPRGQPAGDEGGGPSPIHVGGLGMQPDAGTLKPDNPLDPDNPDLKRERKPGGTPHGGEGGGPAPTGDDEPS
jgi:hypothetical protein